MSNRVFKLLNNEVIIGSIEVVQTEAGHAEILVKKPFTAAGGNLMPYMANVMGSSPAAIQIHPMNILWSVPLDEFPEADRVYSEATSGVVKPPEKRIIT